MKHLKMKSTENCIRIRSKLFAMQEVRLIFREIINEKGWLKGINGIKTVSNRPTVFEYFFILNVYPSKKKQLFYALFLTILVNFNPLRIFVTLCCFWSFYLLLMTRLFTVTGKNNYYKITILTHILEHLRAHIVPEVVMT